MSFDLYAMGYGPDPWVVSYAAYIINGKRFHTKHHEQCWRTQNSRVFVTGEHETKNADFYGVVNDVLELHYMEYHCVFTYSNVNGLMLVIKKKTKDMSGKLYY